MGAAFLIKTDIFREIGFFDEYYFFCPEDIAVSTLLRKNGYKCMVNADITQYHIQGGTWSIIQTATEPAHYKGSVKFFSNNSIIKKIILMAILIIRSFIRASVWAVIYCFTFKQKAKYKMMVYLHTIYGLISSKTPKELFVKFYNIIKK